MLRAANPGLTAAKGRSLCFEAPSQRRGVYARTDLLSGMLVEETCDKGTTRVDFNSLMPAEPEPPSDTQMLERFRRGR